MDRTSQKSYESKLYLKPQHGHYGEETALAAVAQPLAEGRLLTRFDVSAGRYDELRFDPTAGPGLFRVHALRWIDPVALTAIHELSCAALDEGLSVVRGVRLPGDPAALAFLTLDDDPQIALAWPADATSGRPCSVEVEWSVETTTQTELARIAKGFLDGLPPEPEKSPHERLAEALDVLVQRVDGERLAVAAELDALRIAAKRDRLSFDGNRTAVEAMLADATGREAALAARVNELEKMVEIQAKDTARSIDALHREREALEAGIADLRAQLVALQEAQRRSSLSPAAHRSLPARIARFVSSWLDFVWPWRFRAEPHGDLAQVSADGEAIRWRATGDDPRYVLAASRRGMPSAGWYLLKTQLEMHGERVLVDPCLYPDYGDGLGEGTRIQLAIDPGASGQSLLIKFDGDVRSLRLDPSTLPCEFTLGAIRMRKLTRTEAALRMAWPTLRKLAAARQLGVAARDFAKVLRAGGVAEVERRLRALSASERAVGNYAAWVARFDTMSADDLARMKVLVESLPARPRLSIVMPVYDTPEQWLRRCIDTVIAQTYPDWELCVADDASKAPHVRRVLAEYAVRDPRIRPVYREKNGHISAASNSALDIATGDYVVLLDHDDELPPHALFMIAERLAREPHLDVVYTDEDKIDEDGRRYDPYFKPDWNPDLFLSQNYVSHLGVYRASLVREVGGFRIGYEGSQDYDLALRCIERSEPERIGHIPHVLYHWRALSGSTALASGEKSYARDAGLRALRDHFARTGQDVVVEENETAYYRRRYALPPRPPLVSLVIPTRDKVELLRMSIGTILERTDYPNYEVVIVDNQSCEPATFTYFDELAADPRVRVLRYDKPFNFSAINNFAVGQVRGELVGLVNNDIEVTHADWLTEMVSHALRPGIGAVGAMLYYPDGRIQHAGVILGFGGIAGHAYQCKPHGHNGQMNRCRLVQNLTGVTAACLILRREYYDAVGGLEEGLHVAFNDVDFCLRLEARGLRNLWTPYAELNHHESASRGYEDSPEKLARFHGEVAFMQRRWGSQVVHDPAYSLNLDLVTEPYTLAWPPRAAYPFRQSGV